MNYQPFLEMNLLVSDPMLQALQEYKFYFIFMAVLTFYLIVLSHYLVYKLFKSYDDYLTKRLT